jgi:putative nucleotide binding protein
VVALKRDDYVRILDYLPKGKSEVPPHKRKPLAQAIGDKYFSLLELSPKEGITLEQGVRVYIGEGSRDKIDHIERRIKHEWLTPTAKSELPSVLRGIVLENEQMFIDFYNTAGTISTRQHKLECLPKIGKRHRKEIVSERDMTAFKDFEDMRSRLKNIPDPVKVIVDKIIEELKGESKYHLFVPLFEETRRR